MRPERQQRELLKAMLREPPRRERTFAEVFPWRNVARAVMLLVVILGIVALKRSTGSMLTRIGDLWGPAAPGHRATARSEYKAHLGPGLTPPVGAPAVEAAAPQRSTAP